MLEFWNTIVETNTFNFAVMIVIFAIIFQKMHLPALVSNIQNKISESIENAQKARSDAEKALRSAKKQAKNTDKEIEDKLSNAKMNVKNLISEIKKSTEIQINKMKENINRTSLSEEKKLTAKLTDDTLHQAIDIATKNIKLKLKNNPELHNRIINQSIEELANLL